MKRLLVAILPLVMLAACARHNPDQDLADRVTRAVIANDMRPVQNDFNAATLEHMSHAAVGRVSDQLTPLGKFQGVSEISPPPDAKPGYRYFSAKFDKATWVEDMKLDSQGKIEHWHIREPLPTATATP